jgi:hypothetical protein
MLPVEMPEAEWNDERTKIICELFVEQVQAGNRPNTHLNNIGYRTVASKFQQRTQLLYTKMQLKNKWDKFKSDYICWKKLLVAGSGAGLYWDSARGTFAADEDWWKKINKVHDTQTWSAISFYINCVTRVTCFRLAARSCRGQGDTRMLVCRMKIR